MLRESKPKPGSAIKKGEKIKQKKQSCEYDIEPEDTARDNTR